MRQKQEATKWALFAVGPTSSGKIRSDALVEYVSWIFEIFHLESQFIKQKKKKK